MRSLTDHILPRLLLVTTALCTLLGACGSVDNASPPSVVPRSDGFSWEKDGFLWDSNPDGSSSYCGLFGTEFSVREKDPNARWAPIFEGVEPAIPQLLTGHNASYPELKIFPSGTFLWGKSILHQETNYRFTVSSALERQRQSTYTFTTPTFEQHIKDFFNRVGCWHAWEEIYQTNIELQCKEGAAGVFKRISTLSTATISPSIVKISLVYEDGSESVSTSSLYELLHWYRIVGHHENGDEVLCEMIAPPHGAWE